MCYNCRKLGHFNDYYPYLVEEKNYRSSKNSSEHKKSGIYERKKDEKRTKRKALVYEDPSEEAHTIVTLPEVVHLPIQRKKPSYV